MTKTGDSQAVFPKNTDQIERKKNSFGQQVDPTGRFNVSTKIASIKRCRLKERSKRWTDKEIDILKDAIKKFGIGRWKLIRDSGCLPRKTMQHMIRKTKKLIGKFYFSKCRDMRIDIDELIEVIQKNELANFDPNFNPDL